ncbi:amidase signature domain-containing protein [Pyrenochaeta sp. MPI-SDFR-AT-0127]|nr:amidase signature domain-containing protein [Pyrenochaeta sp. MPI-SDFR-AT-0127]
MSLFKHAKTYLINQSKYAHLNAFNSRADPSVLLAKSKVSRPNSLGEEGPSTINDKLIAIKDNICTKDFKTTASSGILKDFTSPYDATVVTLLQDAGAVVVGKTNMDEFGMGSHSTHSHFGSVKMQRFEGDEASAGGSSGGSALAVASAQCWAALGTDTGGSVRLPAAYTGVVGFKPSYGLLSRWGVIAYANSLDTVGIMGRNARHVETIFDKLNVHDPKDPTSLSLSTRSRLRTSVHVPDSLRIGIPLDYNIATLHPSVRKAWIRTLKQLWERGHTLHPVRLPATQHALSAYYVLAPAEASSNLAKYDGVRYGSRAEGIDGTPDSVLFAKTRGQGFGAEVQRRILLGAFSLSAQAIDNYFIQAQKLRRLAQSDFDRVFATSNPLLDDTATQQDKEEDKVDVLLCPTAPSPAPLLSDIYNQDPVQAYMNDVFTVPASLAGLPAINVPVPASPENQTTRFEDRNGSFCGTVGIQIIGQYGDDKLVLNVAKRLQNIALVPQTHTGPDMTAWGDSFLGESTFSERKRHSTRAVEFGVTIREAKAMHAAEQREKIAKFTADLEKARGTEHLDKAAALMNKTRAEYIAKFVNAKDPFTAERLYSNALWSQIVVDPVSGEEQGKLTRVTTLLVSALGKSRLNEAAALFKEAPRKYIARFLDEADPIAAERKLYETKVQITDPPAKRQAEKKRTGRP